MDFYYWVTPDSEFDRFVSRFSHRYNANQLLKAWEAFVEECYEGYRWILAEYDNDVFPRTIIESVIESPDVPRDADYEKFRTAVDVIDAKLRAIQLEGSVRPNRQKWWDQLILRYGGPDYASDIETFYHITIHTIPSDPSPR